jgi:TM2 domain-containing membrane protein YozV
MFSSYCSFAQKGHSELHLIQGVGKALFQEIFPAKNKSTQKFERVNENPRAIAVALTIAAGPFGAHRIYLGTTEWVPVFYTLTLGGGIGILPLIDLVYILVSRDLSNCYQNPHVFMWTQKKAGD